MVGTGRDLWRSSSATLKTRNIPFQWIAPYIMSYNREMYSDGTTLCLKGTPDVKIYCKTVMIVFLNPTAKQGKITLATYSPQRQTN